MTDRFCLSDSSLYIILIYIYIYISYIILIYLKSGFMQWSLLFIFYFTYRDTVPTHILVHQNSFKNTFNIFFFFTF